MFRRQGCPVGPVEFVFGVYPVVAEDVAVAFDNDQIGCCRWRPVGGDAVAGSVGVVDVAPFQAGPGVGVVVVGGDEPEFGRVDAGWVAERVDGGNHQEVERFDLRRPSCGHGCEAERAATALWS